MNDLPSLCGFDPAHCRTRQTRSDRPLSPGDVAGSRRRPARGRCRCMRRPDPDDRLVPRSIVRDRYGDVGLLRGTIGRGLRRPVDGSLPFTGGRQLRRASRPRRRRAGAVKRFLGGEGAGMDHPGNQPLAPKVDGRRQGLRADHRGDPAPDRRHEGADRRPRLQRDLARAAARRTSRATRSGRSSPTSCDESTGIHFHGQRIRTRWTACRTSRRTRSCRAIRSPTSSWRGRPARTCTTSHHNATDQVGRGLLGAFIVEPKDPRRALRPAVRGVAGHRLDQQRLARRVHDQRPRASRRRRRSSRTSATRSRSAS